MNCSNKEYLLYEACEAIKSVCGDEANGAISTLLNESLDRISDARKLYQTEEQKDIISLEAELDVCYNKFKHVIRINGESVFSSNGSELAKEAYNRLVGSKGKLFTYQKIDSSLI